MWPNSDKKDSTSHSKSRRWITKTNIKVPAVDWFCFCTNGWKNSGGGAPEISPMKKRVNQEMGNKKKPQGLSRWTFYAGKALTSFLAGNWVRSNAISATKFPSAQAIFRTTWRQSWLRLEIKPFTKSNLSEKQIFSKVKPFQKLNIFKS